MRSTRTPVSFFAFAVAAGCALSGCGGQATPPDSDESAQQGSQQFFATAKAFIQAKAPDATGKALCLDAKDQGTQPGTALQLWECAQSDNQQFRLTGNRLQVYGKLCIEVGRDDRQQPQDRDGQSVSLQACNSRKKAQRWHADKNSLRWADSDKCLDIKDGNLENGASLQLWTCNYDSQNQAFALGLEPRVAPVQPAAANKPRAGGTRLDVSKWQQEQHDPYKFNNEWQRYTNNWQNVGVAADGTLTITARKDGGGTWTSARLSGDEVGQLPAYYEATITLPRGAGTWPAFWLTSRGDWPQGGEIDIMEQANGDGSTHISTHWGATTGQATFNTTEKVDGVDLSQPHRYGGYIAADGIQFYLDGKPIGNKVVFPAESNFSAIASKMVPVVNLAMGGDWPKTVPDSTGEQQMVVHSVIRGSSAP